MYRVYIDGVPYPVTPSSIEIKYGNKNTTISLLNDGEVNIPKEKGLTEVSFDLMLPNTKLPFAYYENEYLPASYFLYLLRDLKAEKSVFQLLILRFTPGGDILWHTNLTCTLEDFSFTEDAEQGPVVTASVTFKQYVDFSTQTCTITETASKKKKKKKKKKKRASKKKAKKNTVYTVKKGDCLWAIAKKYYNDGSKYPAIYKANKKVIDAHKGGPNMIWPGDKLKIPALK
jgi:LysM repeat protein